MQVPDEYWDRFKNKKLEMLHYRPGEEDLDFTRAALAMRAASSLGIESSDGEAVRCGAYSMMRTSPPRPAAFMARAVAKHRPIFALPDLFSIIAR